jgi:protein-disulfide isomerase
LAALIQCMNEKVFWEFQSYAFQNQPELDTHNALLWLEQRPETDHKAHLACARSNAALNKIRQDVAFGIQLKVSGTPTILINREQYRGEFSFGSLHQAIMAAKFADY